MLARLVKVHKKTAVADGQRTPHAAGAFQTGP